MSADLPFVYLSWSDASGALQTLTFDVVLEEEWSSPAAIPEHPIEEGANVSDHIRVLLRKCMLRVFVTNEPIAANQWSDASFTSSDVRLPAVFFEPWDGVIHAPEWESNLELRALALSAGGLVGGLAGGAVGGIIGAAVGSAIGGALLEPKAAMTTVQTNAGLQPGHAPPPIKPWTLAFDSPDDFVLRTIATLEYLRASGQTVDVIGTKTDCRGRAGIEGMAIEELTHSRGADDGTGATITIGLKEIRTVSTKTVPAPQPAPKATRAKKPESKGNQEPSELEKEAAALAAAYEKGRKEGMISTSGQGS